MTDATVRIAADVSGIRDSLETVISSLGEFQTLVNTTGQDLIQNTRASADALDDVNTGISNLNDSFQDTHDEIVQIGDSLDGLSDTNQQILDEARDQTRAIGDQTTAVSDLTQTVERLGGAHDTVARAIHRSIQDNNNVQERHTNLLQQQRNRLRQINRTLQEQTNTLRRVNTAWQQMLNGMYLQIIPALGKAVKGLFLDIISGAKEVMLTNEGIIGSFNAITDNVTQARVVFEQFNSLSREMTQSFDDIAKAVITVGKTGIKPTNELLKAMGSIADGTGQSLTSVAQSVSNAMLGQTKGLRQLGITAQTEGDKLKVTFKGVTSEIDNSAKGIQQYIQDVAKNNFAEVTEFQMKGLTGAFKNLGDAWADLMFAFGDSGLGEIIRQSVWTAVNALDSLSSFINENEWFGAITSDIARNIEEWRKDIKFFWNYVTSFFDGMESDSNSTWNAIGEYTKTYFGNFISLLKAGVTGVVMFAGAAEKILIGFYKWWVDTTTGAVIAIKNAFYSVGTAISELFADIMLGNFSGLGERFGNTISEGLKKSVFIAKASSVKYLADVKETVARTALAWDNMLNDMATKSAEAEKKRDADRKRREEERKRWAESGDAPGLANGSGKNSGGKGGKAQEARDTWTPFYNELLGLKKESVSALEKIEMQRAERIQKMQELLAENAQVTEQQKANALLIINTAYQEDRKKIEKEAHDFIRSLDPEEAELMRLEEGYRNKLEQLEQFHEDQLVSEQVFLEKREQLRTQFEQDKKDFQKKKDAEKNDFFSKEDLENIKLFQGGMNDLSDAFSNLTEGMSKSSAAYKAMFALQKGFAVASATMNAIVAWTKALSDPENPSWYTSLANYASAVALTTGIIQQLASVTMHDKGGKINPGEWGIVGEYGPELIQGPVSVTSRRETADLARSAMSGGDVIVNLYESNDKAGSVESEDDNDTRIINIFVSDIRRGGEMSDAIQNTFNLKRIGA